MKLKETMQALNHEYIMQKAEAILQAYADQEIGKFINWIYDKTEIYQATDGKWYNPYDFEYNEEGEVVNAPVFAETVTELLTKFKEETKRSLK